VRVIVLFLRQSYTGKGSGNEGRANRRHVSREFLVSRSLDGVGAMLGGLERCGDSVARELTRVADVSHEAAERAAASVATLVATAAKASGHGLSGGEGAISSYFSRCGMFRELIYQISAFTFTVTKNICGAFELNEQPGWRMELNTTATAVPLPISCPTKDFHSGNYQQMSELRIRLGLLDFPAPCLSVFFVVLAP